MEILLTHYWTMEILLTYYWAMEMLLIYYWTIFNHRDAMDFLAMRNAYLLITSIGIAGEPHYSQLCTCFA